MSGKLFVVSAPSGAGKTTLIKHAVEHLSGSYKVDRVVTYTTKEPRPGEALQGVDYHFVSQGAFEEMINAGFFIEWSTVYGAYYGSPATVLQGMLEGHSYILIIDRAGAERVKKVVPHAILIWIYTSNIEVLRQRLLKRAGESGDLVAKRLALAVSEIEREAMYPLYDFHLLNEDFFESLAKLCEIFKKFLASPSNERS